ncbi:MAG: hypothetical protein WAP23_01620 [Candidatus Spechtbacterales bacterium]
MLGAQLTRGSFIAYFNSKKIIIALLVAGISAVSIAAYIGIRTMSPPSFGCQPGWHEFLGGIDDNFALPTEPAIPSAGFQLFLNQWQFHRDFDEVRKDKVFGHTFTDIAPDPTQGTVEEAILELHIKPNYWTGPTYYDSPGTPSNDTIGLAFFDDNGNPLTAGWTRQLGNYAKPLQLDLDALPNDDGSTSNLIQSLGVHDLLDVYVEDDTIVDYMKLRVRHSCLPPIPPIRTPVDLKPACTRDIWKCTAWNTCSVAGEQTRVCALSADCPGVETPKPVEEQSCTPPILEPVVDRGPAVPICAQERQGCGAGIQCCGDLSCNVAGICVLPPPACAGQGRSCGAGLPACCGGLACTPSQGALWCLSPPPPQKPTDMKAEKLVDSASPFHFGGQGSYDIIVGSVGTGTASSPIIITDELPPGLSYLSFSDPYSNTWSCAASGQKVTCVYNGTDISPGGFLPALIINVRIATIDTFPSITGDQVENCAIVEYPNDMNPGNDQGCVTAIITPN